MREKQKQKTEKETLRPSFAFEKGWEQPFSPAPSLRKRQTPFPILMRQSDVITLKEAAYRTRKSDKTLRSWCKQFGIGRQTGRSAPIEISAPALEMVMHGDIEALELLRQGARNHPHVRRYFEHLGLIFD